LALGLTALCLGILGIDRRSFATLAAAGIVVGLALQTKYTVAGIPVMIFIYGVIHRRWLGAAIPGVVGTVMFVAWETFIARRYGVSHFLFHLGWSDILKGYQPKSTLAPAIVTLVGGMAGAIGLLGLVVINASIPAILGAAAVIGVAYASLLFAPVATAVFTAAGIMVWLIVFVAAWRLSRRGNRDDLFILIWMAMEIIAFFTVSPFSASRRTMGVIFVMTLLIGRLAATRRDLLQRRRLAWHAVVAGGIVLGLGFFGLDLLEARAAPAALQQVDLTINAHRQQGDAVWFTGHWGLQFYARLRGYEPVVPDHSRLRRGDWLVYAESGVATQHIDPPLDQLQFITDVTVDDPLALSGTLYAGAVPVEHRSGPRLWLRLYRVTADVTPMTPNRPQLIAEWAATRHRPLPTASVRAVVWSTTKVDRASADAAIAAIAASGRDAFEELRRVQREDADPTVCDAAGRAIARISSK
jgi:hypothetical protein